ncbi:phage tailspike protein [Paraburkholderia sp. GAS82]|uniref:phage tailspike protein n=1 Tax=Paraburkholderia sp. GAS82 TaxID=3035137 RepID=UPI003D223437
MSSMVTNPFAVFLDSLGNALQGGSVYIGVPNTDPTKNPVDIYQDVGLTTPFPQPVVVTDGVPTLQGSPRQIFLGVDVTTYSIAVFDSGGNMVQSLPSVQPAASVAAAGNENLDVFVEGTDFTSGTIPTLTLSANPGSADNVFLTYDAAPQFPNDDFTVTGRALTPTAPVPVGITKIRARYGATLAIGTPANGSVTDETVAPNAAIQASKLSFTQNMAGAVALSVQQDLQNYVNIRQFGGKVDGVTDDTNAWTVALVACALAKCALYTPAGTSLCSPAAPITVAASVKIFGDGKYSSIIQTNNVNAQIFSFTGPYVCVEDIQLCGPAEPVSGYLLSISCGFANLNRVCFASYFNAINALGNTGVFRDCDFNVAVTTSSVGITVNGYAGGLTVDGCLWPVPAVQPLAGILVKNCGALQIDNCNIIRQGNNLAVLPGAGQGVASIQATNTFFDSAQGTNVLIQPQSGSTGINRLYFTQCEASSSANNGMLIDGSAGPISGVQIHGLQTNACGANGLLITGANVVGVDVIGGESSGNTGSGVSLNNGCGQIRISELVAGSAYGDLPNATGIFIESGVTGVVLDNCDVANNTGSGISDGTAGAAIIRNCVGYTTANTGTNAIASGGTSIVVNHGLPIAPSPAQIQLTPLGPFSAPPYVDPTTITASQFTVRTATAPGGSTSFGWRATCNGVQ